MSYTFYHSFWTKPMTEIARWGYNDTIYKNIWYFAWSVLSLKKTFPDAKINLHTDFLGEALLKSIPYDNIYVDLEGLSSNKYLWAAGKIKALKNEELGAIHIDGDVIISSEEVLANPQFSDADIIVESIEGGGYSKEKDYSKFFLKEGVYSEYFETRACNCGLVQINNQELKDEYIRRYYFLASKLERRQNIFNQINSRDKHLAFDLLFEQASLYKLCKDMNSKLRVIKSSKTSILRDNNKGYDHYIGTSKYAEENLAKARAAVKELNEDVYNYLTELEAGTE